MPKFTVQAGFVGGWNTTGDIEIVAETPEAACEKLCEMVDEGTISTYDHTHDPGPTFIEFLYDENGKELPVPRQFTERGEELDQRDEHLKIIEGFIDAYIDMLRAADVPLPSALKDSIVLAGMEALAKVYGPREMILVRFFDGAEAKECEGFMTLGSFFRANKDGIDEPRQAEILKTLAEDGKYIGDEGAGGTWRIEAIK